MVIKSLTILLLLPFALQETTDRTLIKPIKIHVNLLYVFFSASLTALFGFFFLILLYVNLFKNAEKLAEQIL